MARPQITPELGRYFLQDRIRLQIDFRQTPQHRGEPPPLVTKPYAEDHAVVPLPNPSRVEGVDRIGLARAIGRRRSHRQYSQQPLSLGELSFLLWASQGLQQQLGPGTALRTVPSAGCRYAFETYLYCHQVQDLQPGWCRFLPDKHALLPLPQLGHPQAAELASAALGQAFVGQGAVTFVWSVVPRRMEWRYAEAAYKVLALDAGHMAQNLYLACEAVGCGTCTVAAYDQQAMDALLGLDGNEEFVIYLAPVGKLEADKPAGRKAKQHQIKR